MNKDLIRPTTLALRWNVSITTLSHWRWSGRGPKYLKLGGRIMYRIQDVEEFEHLKIRQSTSQNLSFLLTA